MKCLGGLAISQMLRRMNYAESSYSNIYHYMWCSLLHTRKKVWLHVIYLGFFQLLVADVAVSDKGSVLLSVFTCSLTIITLRPCSRLKWMLRIQLREWEWMDLMFSLTCSTKLCTGALFIHQTRACSSNPLTKKFRINWQHQSGKQTDDFLPPVRDANNIQYGRKEALSVFYVSSPRFLCQKISCSVESLTSPPLVPQGSVRNTLT